MSGDELACPLTLNSCGSANIAGNVNLGPSTAQLGKSNMITGCGGFSGPCISCHRMVSLRSVGYKRQAHPDGAVSSSPFSFAGCFSRMGNTLGGPEQKLIIKATTRLKRKDQEQIPPHFKSKQTNQPVSKRRGSPPFIHSEGPRGQECIA